MKRSNALLAKCQALRDLDRLLAERGSVVGVLARGTNSAHARWRAEEPTAWASLTCGGTTNSDALA